MTYKDQGLTVGELTIAIGILIIAGLIWSNIRKANDSKQISSIEINLVSFKQLDNVPFAVRHQ